MSADPYSVLGVPQNASVEDIKKAFRRIARTSHPDVAGDDPTAVARFGEARRAYELLMDPVHRARVDGRKAGGSSAGESFFEAFYRRTARPAPGGAGLDDLVADFGAGVSRTAGKRGPDVPATAEGIRTLDLTVAEAFLGGTVVVDGVAVSVPPCSSSGTRIAVGRNVSEVRIVAPASLDEASRALLLAFAQRNPR